VKPPTEAELQAKQSSSLYGAPQASNEGLQGEGSLGFRYVLKIGQGASGLFGRWTWAKSPNKGALGMERNMPSHHGLCFVFMACISIKAYALSA